MDAHRYLEHAGEFVAPEVNPGQKTALEILLPDFDNSLFGMLRGIYASDGVCDYKNEQAMAIAVSVIEARKGQQDYMSPSTKPAGRAISHAIFDAMTGLRAARLEHSVMRQMQYIGLNTMSEFKDLPDELKESFVSIADMEYIGSNFSAQLLAHSLLRLNKQSERLDSGKTTTAKEVREVLCNQRKNFTREFNQYGATISITRDRLIGNSSTALNNKPERTEANIEPWQKGDNTANNWVAGYAKWDNSLHRLCAKYSEFDTFVSLWLWCIDRNLPAIPVLAPRIVDLEMRPSENGLNMNSDVLLCNLETGVIVPIQNKSTLDGGVEDGYETGVVLAAPRSLKLVEVAAGHVAIQLDGIVRSGQQSVTYYGANVVDFMRAFNPFKKQGKHYTPRADNSFEFFDSRILPELVA
jgi:hypothetical protein